jgi:hypothetical protein
MAGLWVRGNILLSSASGYTSVYSSPTPVNGYWGNNTIFISGLSATSYNWNPGFGDQTLSGPLGAYDYNTDLNNISLLNNSGQYPNPADDTNYLLSGPYFPAIIGNVQNSAIVVFGTYENLWSFFRLLTPTSYQGWKGRFGTYNGGVNPPTQPVGCVLSSNVYINYEPVYYPSMWRQAATGAVASDTSGGIPGPGVEYPPVLWTPVNVLVSYRNQGTNVNTTRSYSTNNWI